MPVVRKRGWEKSSTHRLGWGKNSRGGDIRKIIGEKSRHVENTASVKVRLKRRALRVRKDGERKKRRGPASRERPFALKKESRGRELDGGKGGKKNWSCERSQQKNVKGGSEKRGKDIERNKSRDRRAKPSERLLGIGTIGNLLGGRP